MEITDQQKAAVAAWFAAGASLDEIQKRITAEFGIHLTYLDVRLLVAELPQPEEVKTAGEGEDKTDKTPKTPRTEPLGMGSGTEEPLGTDDGNEEPPDEAQDSNEAQTVSAPMVTIDALMLPGTIASGDVTFSDGQTGKWYLDQMGRLGLGGDLPQGYRPSPTDAALFQQQLMGLLQAKGLC